MPSIREAWGSTLAQLTDERDDLLVVAPDVANSTRADIVADHAPDRFIEVGIAEQNAIGVAVGLAAEGFVPWTSSFSPADALECAAMVRWATDHDGPVYMRLARDPESDVFAENYEFSPGRVHKLRDGNDLAIVSTGIQTNRVLAAARELYDQGIRASVIHVPTLKPLDERHLLDAIGKAPLVVTVEDHSVLGGLGGLACTAWASRTPGPSLLPTTSSSTSTVSVPPASPRTSACWSPRCTATSTRRSGVESRWSGRPRTVARGGRASCGARARGDQATRRALR